MTRFFSLIIFFLVLSSRLSASELLFTPELKTPGKSLDKKVKITVQGRFPFKTWKLLIGKQIVKPFGKTGKFSFTTWIDKKYQQYTLTAISRKGEVRKDSFSLYFRPGKKRWYIKLLNRVHDNAWGNKLGLGLSPHYQLAAETGRFLASVDGHHKNSAVKVSEQGQQSEAINLKVINNNEILAEQNKPRLWRDFKDSVSYLAKGASYQFTRTSNWPVWLTSAGAITWAAFRDKDLKLHYQQQDRNKPLYESMSNASVWFNAPFLPILTYATARLIDDEKLRNFSKEYFAALYLALAETGLISQIPIHKDSSEQSTLNALTRGRSTFPSGHVIGLAVLGFKSMQFYGPWVGIPALVAAGLTGADRVIKRAHVLSDVVGSFVISLLASEGTRVAANSHKAHPFYSWIFKHHFSFSYYGKKGTRSLLFSFSY